MRPITIRTCIMSRDPARFGLIGTGRIGQVHASSIATNPDAVLSWVADPFISGAEAIADAHDARPTDAPSELIESGEIDAVLVASPTPTHLDLIEACIDARVPVLCEKPIDLDMARVDSLRPKVESSTVPVAIGFNQRFDPSMAEARTRVTDGEIGSLEQLLIISRDPGPPPASYIGVSGGIFRDMTIHDFDLARHFVGDIVEVHAAGSRLFDEGASEHGDFDTIAVTLRATSGALVMISNSRHSAYGYDQRLEAFGAEGMVQVRNAPARLVRRTSSSFVDADSPFIEPFIERYRASYFLELVEFIKLVRGEPSASPTFDDGRSALAIADAAQRSADEGIVIAPL